MEKGNGLFHKLDKYVGIPIIWGLRFFKWKKNKRPVVINRIAVLHISSIGDNVLLSGPIADLRASYPKAEILFFSGANNFAIAKLIPGINDVIKLPLTSPLSAIRLMKKEGHFDILFDFGPSWSRINAILAFFIKADYKIGFNTPGKYRHYLFDEKQAHSVQKHEIENYRTLMQPYNTSQMHQLPNIGSVNSEKAQNLIVSIGKYCIIHAWSGGLRREFKQWPNKYWVEFVSMIYKDFDTILLTGGPSDRENTAELHSLMSLIDIDNKIKNIAGDFSIAETVFIISKSKLVVSIDTGNAHIAAAAGADLICLQGPASSLRWRPYSDKAIVVNPNKGNYGYLIYGFESNKANDNCMENISVNDVYEAYQKIHIQ